VASYRIWPQGCDINVVDDDDDDDDVHMMQTGSSYV